MTQFVPPAPLQGIRSGAARLFGQTKVANLRRRRREGRNEKAIGPISGVGGLAESEAPTDETLVEPSSARSTATS